MLKALIKKQFCEIISGYTVNKKTGKKRSPGATVGIVLLIIFIFGSVGFAYYGMGLLLANSFVKQGIPWLYFAVMGIMAVFVGAILDTFSAYSTIYSAKDNDLLLSMPIKPSYILLSRMFSLFIAALVFECMVFVPSLLAFLTVSSLQFGAVIFFVLSLILLAVAVTAISCIFGYIVALIGSVFKNKAFISIISTVLILFVYYICYFRINDLLNGIANNANAISNAIKTYLYPMYCLGAGCTGDTVRFLIFALITVVLFAAVCAVLSSGFIKITTKKTAGATAKTKKAIKTRTVSSSLLKREFKHFSSSAAYMMNCGMSLVIMLFAAVMVIVKSGDINAVLSQITSGFPLAVGFYAPIIAAATFLVCSISVISSPSVSLEGNNLWILRSTPVAAIEVLYAKLKMHLILTEIPALCFTLAAAFVFKVSLIDALILAATVFTAVLILGYLGLLFNLKRPKLEWSNETVPIKQSISVLLCMLSGLAATILYGGLLILYVMFISLNTTLYMAVTEAVLAVVCILLDRSLKSKGVRLFDAL